jgi:DNA polymerase sigma
MVYYSQLSHFVFPISHVSVQAYAPLRPLVLVLKYFLTRKGLCEAFTGGLSSYALLLVTARFLQEVRTHVRCVCVCVRLFLKFALACLSLC